MEQPFGAAVRPQQRVLVVDDEQINREMLGVILGGEYDVFYAENGRQALGMIRRNRATLSLVMLDIYMPEMDGFAVLETLRSDEELSQIPVIVLTSDSDAELRSLALGAADFLTKPYDSPELIRARVRCLVELGEGRRIIRAAERDPLTGLYSGSFFFKYAEQLERFHPDWDMDAVAINIDRFHLINELYGRDFGDEALCCLARGIEALLSKTEGIACRQDGDAFLIYCIHRESYEEVLEQLQEAMEPLAQTARLRLRIGVFGNLNRKLDIARQFDRAKTACNMLRDDYTRSVLVYDTALYQREVYSETLLCSIYKALEKQQLKVLYQPQYDVSGDLPALCAAEALVRWQHPELGMISPADFVPLFERNGLILLVDRYVRREAARQLREWRDAFGVSFPLAVNLSRFDLYDDGLIDELKALLQEFGLAPGDLLFELRESAYAVDAAQLDTAMESLRQEGFRVCMDNFGSGGFSTGALFTVPVDELKLDMKYVRCIGSDEMRRRFIKLIMDGAGYLGVTVIAESVETEEECAMLKELGCTIMQGLWFARPGASEEFATLLSDGEAEPAEPETAEAAEAAAEAAPEDGEAEPAGREESTQE